ncbi:glycosyltransferase [Cellvibrio sp. BR]|uniref:glycosyltransferase n=1 Tax=Cellvibrio sp. BR TaxID=1134474 RepID=UPI0002601280|nr:glycosyltransferase [Cellvibrio sp. BR]EIK46679.1 glycosyltransferase [Cellvibrio sp. BR]
MKVMMIITGLGMGGAEQVTINLADELTKLGHKVMIAYLTGKALVLPANTGTEIISIGMTGPKDFFIAYLKLRRLVRDFKPDVVHSHMVHANIMSRLLRISIHIPRLICSAHSNNEGGPARMLAYRLTDSLADISTNVSNDAVRAFIAQGAVKEGRMICTPNGIDTDKFFFNLLARQQIRSDLALNCKLMILAVGRLDTAKDYPNLLHSVALIKNQRADFKVFIAGDGPLNTELKSLATKLNIDSHVCFLGVRYDIASLMSAADIFVLSSAWEGFGLVVAEAMACERLVVATDCGGTKEILGDTGRLVQSRNPTLLAEAILDCFNISETEYSSLGKSARLRIINNYSHKITLKKYLQAYSGQII